MVEMVGIEPTAFCLQSRRSPNISHIPTNFPTAQQNIPPKTEKARPPLGVGLPWLGRLGPSS